MRDRREQRRRIGVGECSVCHEKRAELVEVTVPIFNEKLKQEGELQIPMCRDCSDDRNAGKKPC